VKRANEFIVGLVVLATAAIVVAGALWLSEAQLGAKREIITARFRSLGSLGAGDPVVLRGVRVGRVEAVRLAEDDWVEADLRLVQDIELPPNPAVIAASASLFGEWNAVLISLDEPPESPAVRRDLDEAAKVGGDRLPGASLPDVGELTSQAARIAADVEAVAFRIQEAFDTNAVESLRSAMGDFGRIVDRIEQLVNSGATTLEGVGANMQRGSNVLNDAAVNLQRSLGRVDSATSAGELQTILGNMAATSGDVRAATGDLRSLVATIHENRESLAHSLAALDSTMARIESRTGTLGLLVGDSTLYREATLTLVQVRQLLADVQANPRKYFKFSVF